YRFTLVFGEARETDDAEGRVTETSAVRPTDEAIQAVLPSFHGEIEQVPPVYSAIHVDRARAYDLARAGEKVELKARKVRIDRLALIGRPDPDLAMFEVDCGKGTYVRSLARDIAKRLGTVGHVGALRRTRSGPFRETEAISLASIEALGHSPRPEAALRPVLAALVDIPALAVSGTDAALLRQGRPVEVAGAVSFPSLGSAVCVTAEGRPIAIVRLKDGLAAPVRVFNLKETYDVAERGP
ncbi:MAG: tRNA pseudouridine(55) synthase TruB, partial [Alphaproteobacteria bacterium]|nr:tRNA pseudouridine(55) synthase TruB [Alphaproteobacteria bacterium]